MLQSSDRAENWLDPAGEVVSGKAKVPERFEFNESVKLQLTDECETFKDDSGDKKVLGSTRLVKLFPGKAKVPEHFEFSESAKLQLTDECETFKDDSGDKKKSVSENGGLGLTKLECIWLPRK